MRGHGAGYPSEFAELQREYPIFLRRKPGQKRGSPWPAGFRTTREPVPAGRALECLLPAWCGKGPFLIGFQEHYVDGLLTQDAVMHVDLDHPRVTAGAGEPVFLPQGGNTPTWTTSPACCAASTRAARTRPQCAMLDDCGLIQPVTLDVQIAPYHRVSVSGLHGIDRERLAALDSSRLAALNRAGYLEGAYLMLASLHNMRRLIAEKQRRLRVQDGTTQAVRN